MGSTVRPIENDPSLGLAHEAWISLRGAGATPEVLSRIAHEPGVAARVVEVVMGATSQKLSPTHSRLVQAAAKHFGVKPVEAKRLLGPVPYSAEVLAECAETHVLVPYLGLSLAEVHGLHARLFYNKIAEAWYRQPHQAFAFVKHQPGWYLVQKTVPEGSLNRTWSEQEALVQDSGDSMVIPAAVLVYAAVFHYLQTDEHLFPALYARTSDVSAEGYRVYAGYFGADGLYVGGDWGARRSSIGVAVSRKSG